MMQATIFVNSATATSWYPEEAEIIDLSDYTL